MSWSPTWPNGSQSVKANQSTGAANTTYIETNMNVDHYWNNSSNNDGHHKWVEMTQSGTSAVPVSKTPSTGMDGIVYLKAKSAVEAPDNQDVQPFFTDNKEVGTPGVTQEMQLLAMRACGVFSVGAGPGFAITQNYIHNVTVTRTGLGLYTATFGNSFPSENYLFFGAATTASGAPLIVNVAAGSLAASKTTSFVKFQIRRENVSSVIDFADPLQAWFYCFGG